jgi:hypothetical protein
METTTTTTTITPARTANSATDQAPAWQHRAAVAGGLLFALGNALHPLEHSDAAYRSATWEAAHLVILAALPLLILGLPAVQGRLRARLAGPLATWPVAVSIVGLIGLAPGMLLEAFVAPSIGHAAMEKLEEGSIGVVSGLFAIAFLGGGLGLAWAARRARLAPAWASPMLVVANVAMLGAMGFTGRAAGAVIIAATVAYGVARAALGRGPRGES